VPSLVIWPTRRSPAIETVATFIRSPFVNQFSFLEPISMSA
jgi:hypothetical protein